MLKPLVTETREAVRLDGLWRFAVDAADAAENDRWWEEPLPGVREAAVPASYNDLFLDEEVRSHVGWVYYQREVHIPGGWEGSTLLLRVDAATHAARVYVNDALAGEHVGGYTPFELDITALVWAGSRVRVTIAVDNRLTPETIPPGAVVTDASGRRRQTYRHDFYNYAGLSRSVWLLRVPPARVAEVAITTGIEGTDGVVDYRVEVHGDLRVRTTVRDARGRALARGTGAEGRIVVPDAHLWAPGDGYLHELEIEARDRTGWVVDVYRQPFGIRTVEVRGTQFLINGEPFRFTGFGKHEDTAVRGRGHDDAYLVHDMELLRWTGANSFRTSHYPYAEEVIDYADRQGIVVIGETAAVGLNTAVGGGVFGRRAHQTFGPEGYGDATRAAHAAAIEELIARDRNHPSVVMWSIANEPDSGADGAREYFEPLVELTRRLDPTRPVTFANLALADHANDRIADLFDVICLNRYYGWYTETGDLAAAAVRLEADLTAWAAAFGRPLLVAEYGADTVAGLHSMVDAPWSEEFQAQFLRAYHRVFDRVPAVVGEQVWNFADFATAPSTHRVEGNRKGVFTRDRRPKAAAFVLRERWTSEPAPEADVEAEPDAG